MIRTKQEAGVESGLPVSPKGPVDVGFPLSGFLNEADQAGIGSLLEIHVAIMMRNIDDGVRNHGCLPTRIRSSRPCSCARLHRNATGATVEPVPPCIFIGCRIRANSPTFFATSSSSLRFSSR